MNSNIEQTKQPRMPQIFIGKNYEKIVNNKFSFTGFFFGGIYFLYRKMYLLGIMLYLITLAITLLLPKVIENIIILVCIYLIFSLLIGFITNKVYKNYVMKKLDKIRAKNASYEESASMCEKQGGTNLSLAIVICVILSVVFSIVINKLNLEPMIDADNKVENTNTSTADDENEVDSKLLMSYVGTYVNDANTIKIYLSQNNKLSVDIFGDAWESLNVSVEEDGTIKHENTSFGETTVCNIEQTANGIKVTYSTTDADNNPNTISGSYSKVQFIDRGWTGIYKEGNDTIILNEFSDEIYIEIEEIDGTHKSYLSMSTDDYDADTITYSSDSFGETNELLIEKNGNNIKITGSSTEEDHSFNRMNGTYTKSS